MAGNIVYNGERFGAAAIYTYGSGVSVVCTSADVYYAVAGLVLGSWSIVDNAVLPDAAGAKFTVLKTGFYRIGYSVSASSSKVAKLHADIYVNGDEVKWIAAERDISQVGQVGNFGATANTFLVAGDVVTILLKSDTNATVVTLEHLSVAIERTSAP